MTETKTLTGLIKVKRHGPTIGDVFFAWFFYGIFRMAFYRFLFPWSFFGIALNYMLLFSAISLSFRALFSPKRYIYSVKTEVEPEESSTTQETPHESPIATPYEPTHTEKKDTIDEKTPMSLPPKTKVEPKVQPTTGTRQALYCSACGVENLPKSNFCAACGERLR